MYKTLRKIFHEGKIDATEELANRLSLPATTILPFKFSDEKLFFTITDEVFELLLEAAKLDKKITVLSDSLPKRAIVDFEEKSLIDEIIITNKIEGVHSSKKEINDAINSLKHKSKKLRYQGLVQKYKILSNNDIKLNTSRDIRNLYNDLVYSEVLEETPNNKLDGKLFRKKGVEVVDSFGRCIHAGLVPEAKIIDCLQKSLDFLNNGKCQLIVKTAIFHYLFGYIHPFYDGNGRTNRFISSYFLAKELNYLTGLRLSFAIHNNITKYYSTFSLCQHELNRGDLTPFLILFCKIIVEAMDDVFMTLSECKSNLFKYQKLLDRTLNNRNNKEADIINSVLISTLFSAYGITPAQLCGEFDITRQTVYNRVKYAKDLGLLDQKKIGKQTYYTICLDKL